MLKAQDAGLPRCPGEQVRVAANASTFAGNASAFPAHASAFAANASAFAANASAFAVPVRTIQGHSFNPQFGAPHVPPVNALASRRGRARARRQETFQW